MNERLKRLGGWMIAAGAAWSLALLGLLLHRTGLFSHHANLARTTLDVYRLAGEHWLGGEYLYADRRGFVYGPFFAAFFAPFARLPMWLGVVLWLAINAAALLGGMAAVMRCGMYPGLDAKARGIALLLLLPLALGNLDVLQANPLVTGLILLAYAAVWRERWAWAALGVALAAHCKIYPLAAGLLFVVLAPKRFGWRLALALLAVGLLPFLLQHWDYVRDQYHAWAVTRTQDNRLQYSEKDAPLDGYFLLARLGGQSIPPLLYRAIQVLGGSAIAVYQLTARWKGWAPERIYAGSLALLSIWMTLLGPATESYTYILLAPAAALAAAQAFSRPWPAALRTLAACAVALLLFAVARNSFMPHLRAPWIMAAQPLGAAVFLVYVVFWLLDEACWTQRSAPGRRGEKASLGHSG